MENKEIPQEGDFKIKKKPKKLIQESKVNKVDLSKKEEPKKEEPKKVEDAIQEQQNKSKQNVQAEEPTVELEEITPKASEEPAEVTKEEVTIIKEKPQARREAKKFDEPKTEININLPENVEKLVNFMKETGGTVEDYVTLNKDYTKYDDGLLVREYYKKTRPHLSDDEVSFIMEDNFKYDEEVDEERFVRKQKLAYKEEVAKAKNFLEQMKSKYYDEIKLRPSVTNEQKKAMDFFQRYNKEQETLSQARNEFLTNTKSFFTNDFEGFNFEVGDKKFRYKISNPDEIADKQADVSKFISKFMDKDGRLEDVDGYHKAIYAARNADRIAEHFYEQGKADATKDIVAKSKNINSEPRSGNTGESLPNGWKVRAMSGSDSTKLKIKKRT